MSPSLCQLGQTRLPWGRPSWVPPRRTTPAFAHAIVAPAPRLAVRLPRAHSSNRRAPIGTIGRRSAIRRTNPIQEPALLGEAKRRGRATARTETSARDSRTLVESEASTSTRWAPPRRRHSRAAILGTTDATTHPDCIGQHAPPTIPPTLIQVLAIAGRPLAMNQAPRPELTDSLPVPRCKKLLSISSA